MAQTTVIDDLRGGDTTYYGGYAPPGYQDVVYPHGLTDNTLWDINSMEVTDLGTKIQVKIIGPWFSGSFGGDLYLNSGDLYLSSAGWKHTTDSPHFPTDTFTQAEGWNYVVTYRHPEYPGIWSPEWGVYALDFNATNQFSQLNWTQGWPGDLGRSNQAWYGGYGAKVANATDVKWDSTLGANSYLLYEFDKFLSGDVGLHWTMYCGNDVVEGQANFGVPEPSALILLGFGLAGLGVYKRRAKGGHHSINLSPLNWNAPAPHLQVQ